MQKQNYIYSKNQFVQCYFLLTSPSILLHLSKFIDDKKRTMRPVVTTHLLFSGSHFVKTLLCFIKTLLKPYVTLVKINEIVSTW